MRLVFVAGGTAGHINPALSVAAEMRGRHPSAELLYIGTPTGMESRLAPEAGLTYEAVDVRGFKRSFSWSALKHNVGALMALLRSRSRVRRILKNFEPDLVFGTGGYVTGPVLLQAHRMGIPTVTHEQNAFPGVTTRLLSKKVDAVLVANFAGAKRLPKEARPLVVGNPVRADMLRARREPSRRALGIADDAFVIVSFGGSLGAQSINEAVAQLAAWELDFDDVWHIHGTGGAGVETMERLLRESGVVSHPNLVLREYIRDMPDCLAAADLVISRAGAITLSEIEAVGRAAILVPSPYVAENHQYHNAMELVERDAAIVIEEKDLTGEILIRTVSELYYDLPRLQRIADNAARGAVRDATEHICDILDEALNGVL